MIMKDTTNKLIRSSILLRLHAMNHRLNEDEARDLENAIQEHVSSLPSFDTAAALKQWREYRTA